MATLIPAAGSAYTFSYAAMGEGIAWVVGWSLILEYSLACSTVAVGWSGYLVGWIQSAGVTLPHALLVGPHAGGLLNIPAVLVALPVLGLLVAGSRERGPLNDRKSVGSGNGFSVRVDFRGRRYFKNKK